ncbi:hypothetical protein [Oscillibacter sp.]|uniref:hypothetical protein n=1 Tax=Oscillibacter sp. TaxID=1945593 RepID=UPI00339214C1
MENSHAYINNFFDKLSSQVIKDDLRKDRTLIFGTAPPINKDLIINKISSDVITSLLLYDRIYIKIMRLSNFIDVFGLRDTSMLLEANILKVVDDKGFVSPLIENDNNTFGFGAMFEYVDLLKNIEEKLEILYPSSNDEITKVLYLAESKSVKLISEDFHNKILNELEIEFSKNKNKLFKSSKDVKNISPKDIVNVQRIISLNECLLYGEALKAKNMIFDGFVKSYLQIKFSPYLSKENDGLEIFGKMLILKRVPDLGKLYLKNVITIKDILQIRNNINGKKFRQWYLDKNYSEDEFISELLKKGKTDSNILTKLLRWSIPNMIGLANPVLGIEASGIDSFIIEKIIKGWNPNIFLDDVLKRAIDKKNADYNKIKLCEEGMAWSDYS